MSFSTTWVMEVVDQSSGALVSIGDKAETMAGKIESSSERSSVSMQKVGSSISGVATSAFAMYNLYDRVDDASLRVDTAENRLADTVNRVKFAQDDLNAAIEKYGPGSQQAIDAATRLKAAQDDLVLAQERAQEAHERYNESLTMSIMISIPTVITMITSLQTAWATLGPAISGAVGGLTAAGAACAGLVAAGAAIIGTMVGLGASIVAWKEQTGDWHSATEKVIERLQTFPPVIKEVTEFLAKAAGGWLIAFDKLREGCIGFGQAVVSAAGQVQGALSTVGSAFAGAAAYIGAALSSASAIVVSIFSNIRAVVATIVGNVVSAISSGFSAAASAVAGAAGAMWSAITSALGRIVSYVWSVINSIIDAFRWLWNQITGGSIWPEMFASMEKQTAEGMKGIQGVMAGGLGEITPMVKTAGGEASGGPSTSSITINFTIQGATDPDAVAREVEARIVETLSRRSEVTAG